ncbi:MAG: metal-sensitive transcriptional regulator [Clostridiaceae bacterium]
MEREEVKKKLDSRLRRIEGQVKGIEKMVDSECGCRDVLVQIAAVRAALNKVGSMILQNYAKDCFVSISDEEVDDKKLEELISTLDMFLK